MDRKYLRWGLLSLVVLAMLYGALRSAFESTTHNEALAAKRAEEFAEVALVKHDLDGAYAMMSSKARGYVTLEQFKDTIAAFHPAGYPKTIKIVDTRPVKDMATVYVLLRGEDGSGRVFNYQLMLNGTEKTDYKVTTVKLSSGQNLSPGAE